MAFVEDRQLLELSISPKKPLFPMLNRAETMSPLIVLLALIPPLYVLANRTLTPLDALWGLKAVAISTSDSAATWIDPAMGRDGAKEIPLKWQPPLSSWLIAGVMSLTGTERPLALVLASFLATAGLIVSMFGLSDRLRGPQFAWWTTCLVALNGPILQGAQTPAPVSLTLAFAVATCWGFVVHCQDSKRLFSLPLAWAGCAWGLCLLAGGPLALVVVAVLLLYVLSRSRESKKPKKINGKLRRGWKGRPSLQSLGLLLIVGGVVGGWWELWHLFRHGGEFLRGWFVGASHLPEVVAPNLGMGRQLLHDVSQMGGALTGLTVLGTGVGLRMLKQTSDSSQRTSLALMLAWAGCAGIGWLSLRAGLHPSDAFTVVWRGYCLIPATMLAALAIEQIGTRQIGYFGVLSGLCLTVGVLLLEPVEIGFGQLAADRPLWPSILPVLQEISDPGIPWLVSLFWRLTFIFSLGAGTCWALWRALKPNDFRQRVFLGISLGFLVALHGLIGFLGVRQTTLDDRALAHLRNEMIQEPGVARWTIISPQRSPLTLRFVLTSMWPRIESLEIESWWDPKLTRDLVDGQGPDGAHIIVDWSNRDTRTTTLRLTDKAGRAHIVEFTPVGNPQILGNHRLRMYRLTDRLIPR